FNLVIITWLVFPPGTEMITCGNLLTDTDGTAFCIMDNIIFNYPAFTLVSTYQTRLVRCRRAPGSGRMAHLETPDSDIIYPGLFRIETAFPYIYLYQLFIGIIIMEICINGSVFLIYLGIPEIFGLF